MYEFFQKVVIELFNRNGAEDAKGRRINFSQRRGDAEKEVTSDR